MQHLTVFAPHKFFSLPPTLLLLEKHSLHNRSLLTGPKTCFSCQAAIGLCDSAYNAFRDSWALGKRQDHSADGEAYRA